MIAALVTPVFICCAFIMLACVGCFNFDIPDQDAIIDIYADKVTSNDKIRFETLAAYDTTASTLTCVLHFDSSKTQYTDIPVSLYHDGKNILPTKTIKGIAELGWLNTGTYALQIGNPSKYPCYNIHNVYIPSGRKCELHIYKIPNP